MAKLETYGYGRGLVSNSMLQAAIVCPVKYDLLYNKRVDTGRDGKWFDMAFIGNVLHKAIELHDDNHEALKAECYTILAAYFGPELTKRTQNLMALYEDACRKTQEDGARWDKVYKAPDMTTFFKKNFGGLEALFNKLNEDAEAHIEGSVFTPSYVGLIKHMVTCMNNWKEMRIDAPIASECLLSGTVGAGDYSTQMVGTADRLERRSGGVALCDFKSGKWAYNAEDVRNSDQFGLYHRLLEQTEYGAPVEWTVYNLSTKETVTIIPNNRLLECFDKRLATNLRYFKQLSLQFDKIEVPTPAGSSFKTGCPCILADTGDCPYIYREA